MVLKKSLLPFLCSTRQFSITQFGVTHSEIAERKFFQDVFKKMNESTDEVVFMDEAHYNCPRRKMILLNRPKALNALNLSMVRSIHNKMVHWQSLETGLDMVIIKGAGDKAFCAGGDVLAVTKSAKSSNSENYHTNFFREEYKFNYLIGTYHCPVISIMDGITMGGGCGIALNGMYKVATEKTLLAMPETALGLFPDVGGSYFLSRLKGNLGMFLALTGYRLKGADVFHAGLASNYVESRNLDPLIATLLSRSDAQGDFRTYAAIENFEPKTLPAFTLEPHLETIENCFSGESVEEIIEKLNKNGSDFAKKQVDELKKMSPTSLKVTHRQLINGAKMSFEEIFTMEYRLTQRFMADNDFHEGCRAILIDKDKTPKWNPASLAEVSKEKVDSYFAPFANPKDELIIRRPEYTMHWSSRWNYLLGTNNPDLSKNKL